MRVQVCAEADFDAGTQTCTAPQWVELPGVLPPLSAEEGAAIGAAILGCWIVGAVVRWMRKALD